MKPILVLAAMGQQLKPLAHRLGKTGSVGSVGIDARQAMLRERPIILARTGIGRKAAVEVTRLAVETFEPSQVICIGIAGSLRPDFKVGDPFLVSSACLWMSESENLSIDRAVALPTAFETQEVPLVRRIKGGVRVRRARLLTVDAFVNDMSEKRRLGMAGFDLVDMEFAAVAKEVVTAGLPCSGLMTVSDSLLHNFPSFRLSTAEGMRGQPPPRLVVNALRACKILGGFAHLWLRMLIEQRMEKQ
jgi:adenosylhomocysteine nucleosidase